MNDAGKSNQKLVKQIVSTSTYVSDAKMLLEHKKYVMGAAVISAAFISDQLTKWGIQKAIPYHDGIEIFSFFNLVHVRNYGVTFSFLSNQNPMGWLYLSAVALLVCSFLGVLWARSHNKWEHIAYPMIIGGAIGNIADRIRLGGVVDFLDVHVYGYHWPAFNLADSFIVVGVGILLMASTFGKK